MNTRIAETPEAGTSHYQGRLSPLHRIGAGTSARIRELSATPELTCRLRELGLCEGQVVRLISCSANIICQVCNARLALNAALAEKILVESLAE